MPRRLAAAAVPTLPCGLDDAARRRCLHRLTQIAGLVGLGNLSRRATLTSATALAWSTSHVAAQTTTAPSGRIALVIGNAAYKTAALRNPVNDARAVSARLKDLGFTVIQRENATLREMLEAARDFTRQASKHAVRLVFYAGHGVQSQGRNYLVPVDAVITSEDEIPARAADVGEWIDRLSALPEGINLVVLDACRVNPFGGGVFVDTDGRRVRFRGVAADGLARQVAPAGTLIAYSTAPGGVAYDRGDERHSLYAKHLLTQLAEPQLPIEQVFKRVRVAVMQESSRQQIPWESSSLTADFCFKPDARGRCGA